MIKFYPSVLNGNIVAPASKACGLRMLFAAALASKSTTIENVPECKDVNTAINCLRLLGCKIEARGSGKLTINIEPFSKTVSLKEISFNFKDSATTARYITVIASAYGIPANCQAEGTLLRRSQVSMTSRMALRGASFSNFSYPLRINGRLVGGRYELQGDEGSQFISALLTALPVLRDDSEIVITSSLVDPTYVLTTIDILKQFGITIEQREDGYFIPGQQFYDSPGRLVCENDWGLAAMWTVASAANQQGNSVVSVDKLPDKTHQRYRNISNILALISQDFEDFNVDVCDCPNIATLLAAIAAIKGKTIRISGVPQLKHKETNRLKTIGQCMHQYGVSYEAFDDGLIITGAKGGDYPDSMEIDCQGDPWIYMSLALAASLARKPVILTGDAVSEKIYKDFLLDYSKLGGKFDII